MRKVQDYYFKKAKQDNYPARSVYKLEEAQKKHRFLRKGATVLDLGCHPGSWSLYAAQAVGPKGLVVGVDLTPTRQAGLKGAAPIVWLAGDMREPAVIDQIREAADAFDVVLSDMAPKTTGHKFADQQRSLELARQALALALELLKAGGSFYCKVFEGEDFKEFVDEVRTRFKTVKIVKPKSSRDVSREVFVLGMERF